MALSIERRMGIRLGAEMTVKAAIALVLWLALCQISWAQDPLNDVHVQPPAPAPTAPIDAKNPDAKPDAKTPVPLDSAPARLGAELTAFQDLLLRRATEFRDQRTVTVDTWDEFVAAVATGWARAFHCGQPGCEDDIKAATSATPRVIPADGEPEQGTCIRCGRPSAYGKRLIFGRAY